MEISAGDGSLDLCRVFSVASDASVGTFQLKTCAVCSAKYHTVGVEVVFFRCCSCDDVEHTGAAG